MDKAIRWYVLSNIHIALCAAVFLAGGFQFFGANIDYYVLTFIGVGTWLIYLLHRVIGGRQLSDNYGAQRFDIASLSTSWLVMLILLSTLINMYCLIHIKSSYYLPLVVLGLISGAYILPMLGDGKRLRDIGHLKIFLIVIVWSGVFVMPYWGIASALPTGQLITVWAEKALFIFALTLPFDIRDRDLDRSSKVSTLASTMSVGSISNLITGSIVILIILVVVCYLWGVYSGPLVSILILLYLFQWLLSRASMRLQHEFFFLLVLDSFILLQGIIHWYH